jgi:hypothetical protein
LFGDAGEADTCGAQLDESLNGLLIFHNQPVVTGATGSYGDRSGFSCKRRVHANGPSACVMD